MARTRSSVDYVLSVRPLLREGGGWLSILTLLLCGCGADKCLDSTDCERGSVCRQDRCQVVECFGQDTCGDDEICAGGRYVDADPSRAFCNARCNVFNPCRSGEKCKGGLCHPSDIDNDVKEFDSGGDDVVVSDSQERPDLVESDLHGDTVDDVPRDLACEAGFCCRPKATRKCHIDDNVHYFDSCGNPGDVVEFCECGCTDGYCDCCPACPACSKVAVNDGCQGICESNCDYVCIGDECCRPSCAGHNCGPDGCGGSCGSCQGSKVCDEQTFTCVDTCVFPDDLPSVWGIAGVVTAKAVPANATEKLDCHDYTGDGVGDSGLTVLASQLNPSLADMIADGSNLMAVEIDPSTPAGNYSSFRLNILAVKDTEATTTPRRFFVKLGSFNQETCQPFNKVLKASIDDDILTAGPFAGWMVGFGLSDTGLEENTGFQFGIVDCYIRATVAVSPDGISTSDGTYSCIMQKKDFDAAMAIEQAKCDIDPESDDFCAYLDDAKAASGMLYDLHQVSPGAYILKSAEFPGNASSICKKIQFEPAEIVGYVAE